MKKKTQKAIKFIDGLKRHLQKSAAKLNVVHEKERVIHRELAPFIESYLRKYFKSEGYINYELKATNSFFKEYEPGKSPLNLPKIFTARSYVDYAILEPYKIAIEYKQDDSGSMMKKVIGQGIMHTISNSYDFTLIIFHDLNKDNSIYNSMKGNLEKKLINDVWVNYNVRTMVLPLKK